MTGISQTQPIELDGARTVIITGDFWHGASERGVAYGMREMGWNVVELNAGDHVLRSRTIPLKIAGRLLTRFSAASFNVEIESALATIRCDLLLMFKGSYVSPRIVDLCRAAGIKTALYYPDVYFANHGIGEDLVAGVDLFFTTKRFHADYLDRLRGRGRWQFLPHGYSPLVHRPHRATINESDFLYDIAYIGNPDRRKIDWITEVARRFPDKRMIVAGDRWAGLASGTPLEGRVARGRITGDVMAEIVQRSRINLAVHSAPDGQWDWRDKVSTRTFEIPACRGLMVHEDNHEVREMFVPEKEFVPFESLDDMCDRIAHFLPLDEERRAIAENGHNRAVPAYSYYERARAIIERFEAGT